MSRKHFEQFADLIREMKKDEDITPYARRKMARMVGVVASWDNLRFSWEKFLAACEIPMEGEGK